MVLWRRVKHPASGIRHIKCKERTTNMFLLHFLAEFVSVQGLTRLKLMTVDTVPLLGIAWTEEANYVGVRSTCEEVATKTKTYNNIKSIIKKMF